MLSDWRINYESYSRAVLCELWTNLLHFPLWTRTHSHTQDLILFSQVRYLHCIDKWYYSTSYVNVNAMLTCVVDWCTEAVWRLTTSTRQWPELHSLYANKHTCRRIRRDNKRTDCTTPLFYVLAPTCFGSSLPSSASLLDPPELLELQIGRVVYHITCENSSGPFRCVLMRSYVSV
jgi:hypothetical protein